LLRTRILLGELDHFFVLAVHLVLHIFELLPILVLLRHRLFNSHLKLGDSTGCLRALFHDEGLADEGNWGHVVDVVGEVRIRSCELLELAPLVTCVIETGVRIASHLGFQTGELG